MNQSNLFRTVENLVSENPEGKSNSFNLEYYIIEGTFKNQENASAVNVYGIEVVKRQASGTVEKNLVEDIYCNREMVENLAEILAKYSVTPLSLGYVIEDILGA